MLPDMLDEYVDEDNEVRFVDAFVDSLDLAKLGFRHAERYDSVFTSVGRPPFDPRDLLKLYVWGYLNQIRSSRKLERECHRNTELMWLLKKLAPNFWTISEFRKQNIDCIRKVFKDFVSLCVKLDLFGGELVGIDGTKLKAVNSKDRNFSESKIKDRLRRIEESTERYLSEVHKNDSDDEVEASRDSKNKLLCEKIEKLKTKKKDYELLLEKLKASGQGEISLTDPDSRLMLTNQRHDVCYNLQASVDSKYHLIPVYSVTNSSSDRNQLSSMAKSTKETLGVQKLDVASDEGYFDAQEIKDCLENNITPFLPVPKERGMRTSAGSVPEPEFFRDKFVYNRPSDTYVCPAGHEMAFQNFVTDRYGKKMRIYGTGACGGCPLKPRCTTGKKGRTISRWEFEEVIEEMNLRARTVEGSSKMLKRKELCEHPFGTVKRAFNQGYLHLKGLKKVTGEAGFTILAYNMRRAINILGAVTLSDSIHV